MYETRANGVTKAPKRELEGQLKVPRQRKGKNIPDEETRAETSQCPVRPSVLQKQWLSALWLQPTARKTLYMLSSTQKFSSKEHLAHHFAIHCSIDSISFFFFLTM